MHRINISIFNNSFCFFYGKFFPQGIITVIVFEQNNFICGLKLNNNYAKQHNYAPVETIIILQYLHEKILEVKHIITEEKK